MVSNFYAENLTRLQAEQKKLLRKKSALGVLRFGSIAALVAVFYFLWSIGWIYVTAGAVLLLFVFVQLLYKDLSNKAAIEHLSNLILVNEDEIKALSGNYYHFKDGNELQPKEHSYANDMDILGHASLFQLLNRTTSEMGAKQLADWLLHPSNTDTIVNRQKAVKELSEKIHWRQKLQAYGKESSIRLQTLFRLQRWMQEPTAFIQFKAWKWLRYLLPGIMLGISAAAWFDLVGMNVFYGTLFLFAVIAFQINKFVAPIHEQLSKMVDELDAMSQSIETIERESFTSELLMGLQRNFRSENGNASEKLRYLKKMLDRLDLRYNIVLSAPLNLWLLWNLQQVLDLEKWKRDHTDTISNWFTTLGEYEALCSFAALHFDQPEWVFPVITENHFSIEATALGHPLINPNKRVNNFINIHRRGEIMIVTGSNMAGKSTYLRSVGINVILAMAGAPVCAKYFSVSPVHVISSMRIADNLEESTSTFYAELKKLKAVIDKVNAGEKVFVLLDEILRGTNSLDRHTGSVALVKQLIRQKAAAIIATHDIALAELRKEFPDEILNYHFDVQVSNEELYFDYKLKPGICASMNASILMKKIGIEL